MVYFGLVCCLLNDCIIKTKSELIICVCIYYSLFVHIYFHTTGCCIIVITHINSVMNLKVSADVDNDDYDDICDDDNQNIVQLGILQKSTSNITLFKSKDWSKWDGGKVGGEPIWLNPEHQPKKEDLQCFECKSEMKFLLQIYCPLDDIEDSFHRCLYIFTCKKSKCVLNGNVKCIRVQLPRKNNYYVYDCATYDETGDSNVTSSSTSNGDNNKMVCQICR